MAQGNYVPISGVNANWSEGLSSALANLSKTYASQAEAEKERARLAAADAESKRRYEQDRADIAARNALTDAENKRRWDIQEGRSAQAEARAVKEAEFIESERTRAKTNRDVLGQLTVDFGADNLGPNVQSRIAQAQEHINTTRTTIESNVAAINQRRNFLTPEGGFSEAGNAEYQARYADYLKMYNDPAEAAELAKADVVTMRNNALANDYETKARAELAAVETAFNNQLSRLGTKGTVEEFIAAGQAQLAAAGHQDPYSKEVRDELRARALDRGLKTRGDLIAAGQTATETAYQREKDRIGFMQSYYTAAGTGSSGSGSKGVSDEKFVEFISNLDLFGVGDRDRAVKLYQTLKNDPLLKGVNEGFIREAIILTSTKGLDDETLGTDPKEINTIATLATDLAKGNTTGKQFVAKKDFEINQGALKSYSADELMGRRFDLQVPKTYTTPREVLARPDVAAFKAQQAAEQQAKEAPQAAEQQAKEAQAVLDEARKSPLPVDGTVTTARLKELLGDRLDLSPGKYTNTGPARFAVSIPIYSPQQRASRELLEVQQNIEKWRQQKARFAGGGVINGAARRERQRWIDEATARRQELYDQLMGR